MLWMKAWFETRWRLLYSLALPLAALSLPYVMGSGVHSAKEAQTLLGVMAFFSVFFAVFLAGAGIRTQAPFAAMKGLDGSKYFTLSLPVSRFRLIAVRAGVGFLEFASVIVIVYCTAWILFRPVLGNSTPADLFEFIFAAITCTACFHFVSVLLATFLDDVWQNFASLLVAILAWLAVSRISPNGLAFLGTKSPLITHSLPWPAIAISIALSAILFFAALKIVQTREY
jgi:ABC-2 type transport system permease protein